MKGKHSTASETRRSLRFPVYTKTVTWNGGDFGMRHILKLYKHQNYFQHVLQSMPVSWTHSTAVLT